MSATKKYYDYHLWATKKLVARLSHVEDQILKKEIQSSFPSISLTLVHMAWAENIWLNRLDGEELRPHEEWLALTPTMLMDEYIRLCRRSVHFLKHADRNKHVRYQNTGGDEFTQTIEEIGIHLINHASYHRGQIVTMMRHHNLDQIPAFDFIAYCRT